MCQIESIDVLRRSTANLLDPSDTLVRFSGAQQWVLWKGVILFCLVLIFLKNHSDYVLTLFP